VKQAHETAREVFMSGDKVRIAQTYTLGCLGMPVRMWRERANPKGSNPANRNIAVLPRDVTLEGTFVLMRLIGTLPDDKAAVTFSNVLLTLGIEHQMEHESDSWAVWIHSEDDCSRASTHLAEFVRNPSSREIEAKAREGAVRRRISDEEVAGARFIDGKEVLSRALPDGVGALTAVLTVICLAIAFVAWAGYEERVIDELMVTRVAANVQNPENPRWDASLPEVFKEGEFWRLITPTLVHFTVAHLLVSLLCLIDLGSAIEAREGTGRLAILFLTIGVGSNLAQAYLEGPAICGISGVLYGLLGYIWMKGKFHPESGLGLHPYTVVLMLVFFFLGLGGALSAVFGMAVPNGAHAAGLLMGVGWGFLSSLSQIRQRRRPHTES
jgi:GlpG protein